MHAVQRKVSPHEVINWVYLVIHREIVLARYISVT